MWTPKPHVNDALYQAIENGNMTEFLELLPNSRPLAEESQALSLACQYGQVEMVNILLPISNPRAANGKCLTSSAIHGQMECLHQVLPYMRVKNVRAAVCAAVEANQLESVQFFLTLPADRLDIKMNNSRPLLLSVIHGHLECMNILLPFTNPKGNHSEALRLASIHNRAEMMEILYPLSDIEKCWEVVEDNDPYHEQWDLLRAYKERQEIAQHINHNAPNKKIRSKI